MDEKAALRAEVEALQSKLHQLHATDVNTFRRSYGTIAQHVEALKVEASRLEALVQEVEPDVYTPEFVAEEFGKAAVVGGAGWVLYKIVKSIPPLPAKAKSWLGGSLVVATAVVISWRFASSSIGRFASAFFDHRRRKKAFLKELAELQHRIDILQALTSSLPGAVLQPNLAALAAQEATAAAGTGTTGTPTAGSLVASRTGSGGNGGREQFVVVDLPRVESGGFVLPSPVPSPPPAVMTASLPPVHPGGVLLLGGGVLSRSSSAGPFGAPAQQQLPAPGPYSTGQPTASAGAYPALPGGDRLAAVLEGRPVGGQQSGQQQLQQLQEPGQSQGEVEEGAATSSGGRYQIPDSVMTAGWGGVTQQRPQQLWQQPAGLQAAPPVVASGPQHQQAAGAGVGAGAALQQPSTQQQQQASPASRQWSSGTDFGDEGEFVEQLSDAEEQAGSRRTAGQLLTTAGGGAAGSVGFDQKAAGSQSQTGGLQRGSPASSLSEDAVLLERE